MKAEIDQSGKIEQLNTHTVVALANSISSVIYITITKANKKLSSVFIDIEYSGKNDFIKGVIGKRLKRRP